MSKRNLFILTFALTCISAFPLSNAEIDSISRQFELDEVVVSSTTTTPHSVSMQTLDGQALQTLNVHSVADALRHFSGVQIKDYGGVGGLKTIDIRAMGSHHLGVFYDGIEIGNAQNGTVDLGKFSLENVESLALFHGQRNEIFQPAKDFSSASALYIRTRRPQFADGQTFHIVATMKAGAFGVANPSLLYEQRLTDNLHLSLNAEYAYATGRYHFTINHYTPDGTLAWDTTGVRQNGDIQSIRAEVGLFGYLPQGKWHLKGYYYQSERGIPRAIIRNVWTTDQRQWDRNAFVQTNFTNTWNCYSLQVNAKYSNDYLRYLNPDTTAVYIDHSYLQQEVYVSLANRWTLFPWWDLALSADYIYNHLDANQYGATNHDRHTELIVAATDFHYKWLMAQASVLGTFVQDVSQTANVSPAATLRVQPYLPEQLYIQAFYKQSFRMPTFNELYYTDGGISNLKPEDARQYDLGVEYQKRWQITDHRSQKLDIDLQAKVDGYFNQVSNKIVAIPKGNTQYRWQMMNLGYVEMGGVDINASVHCAWSPVTLTASGTYSYQRAMDKTNPYDPLTYNGQIAYTPWHSGSATASIEWHGWRLGYIFNYVGERYSASANIATNYVAPWDTHDLVLSYQVGIRNKDRSADRLKIAVELNNIANKQYEIVKNYPMPGLNGKVVIQYTL